MFITYPMAHRIHRPQPYVPCCATDIRKTFAAERERLARQEFERQVVAARAEQAFHAMCDDGPYGKVNVSVGNVS